MRRLLPISRRCAAVALLAAVAVLVPQATGRATGAAGTEPAESRTTEPGTTLLEAAEKYFPGEESDAPTRRIFRLTRDQIDATVATLLPNYHEKSVKAVMARDPLQTNYEYAELLSFNASNLGPLAGWIKDIAARVKKSPAGVIDCAAASNSAECLERAARSFVIRAFRGDVHAARIDKIAGFFLAGVKSSGLAQATADLVEVVLSSPQFLYREELGGRYGRLAPAERLQGLTYTLADAPPEAVKLSSLDALAHLQTEGDASATVDTILRSPASREKLVRFFKAWLEVKEPGEFTISTEVFPAFTAKLEAAMLEETDKFLRARLSTPAPRLSDITQATQTFVPKALEPIYGVKGGNAGAATPVDVDPAQRFGIFSQPAVLASHSGPTDTRPIKRGVFWVRKVMCMEMEPPPPGLDIALYESKGGTERQRIQAATKGKACIGCHKKIDPFGFAFESYDALGQWRTTENGLPIDSSVKIDFLDEGPQSAATPVEALKIFTGSLMFKQCFVRQLFRYYMGRNEEPADDPELRRMFLAFAADDKQDILGLVRALAGSDQIRRRR